MKKRKFLFIAINLFAAAGVAFSIGMDWLGGEAPRVVSLASIMPFDLPSQITELYLSVATLLAIGAVFIGIGGLISMRSMVATGLAMSLLTAGCRMWHFGFEMNALGMNDGFSLFAVSFVVSFLSLVLHRHQRHHDRKKYGHH